MESCGRIIRNHSPVLVCLRMHGVATGFERLHTCHNLTGRFSPPWSKANDRKTPRYLRAMTLVATPIYRLLGGVSSSLTLLLGDDLLGSSYVLLGADRDATLLRVGERSASSLLLGCGDRETESLRLRGGERGAMSRFRRGGETSAPRRGGGDRESDPYLLRGGDRDPLYRLRGAELPFTRRGGESSFRRGGGESLQRGRGESAQRLRGGDSSRLRGGDLLRGGDSSLYLLFGRGESLYLFFGGGVSEFPLFLRG